MASDTAKQSVEAANDAASRAASSASASTSSAIDRLSAWYSENKALAWTIVGAAVVGTSAAVYYTSSSTKSGSVENRDRKSKKERRREKEAARDAAKSTESTGECIAKREGSLLSSQRHMCREGFHRWCDYSD